VKGGRHEDNAKSPREATMPGITLDRQLPFAPPRRETGLERFDRSRYILVVAKNKRGKRGRGA
jgi:hypothetical protein